ncbi:MAG TPA: hypothetical protein VFX66_02935, partial [Sulfuricurvum sp.]|nr:hypothetical protein [Sulfuricurvum sp.]
MTLFHRSLILVTLLSVTLDAAKIDARIKSTASKLDQAKQTYTSLNTKLEATATKILQQKQVVGIQQQKINTLVTELNSKATVYQANKSSLQSLETQQNQLIKTQNDIEQKLVFALARNTSISLLINDDRAKEANAIITEEALKLHLKQINQEIKELNAIFGENAAKISTLASQTTVLKQSIAVIDKQKQNVLATKQENEKAIAALEKEKAEYKRSLGRILNQQKSLQNTLASLNIIKQEAMKPKKAPPTLVAVKPGSKPLPEGAREAISE